MIFALPSPTLPVLLHGTAVGVARQSLSRVPRPETQLEVAVTVRLRRNEPELPVASCPGARRGHTSLLVVLLLVLILRVI